MQKYIQRISVERGARVVEGWWWGGAGVVTDLIISTFIQHLRYCVSLLRDQIDCLPGGEVHSFKVL